ncbi:MAG: hypothetical protein ABW250_19525, partial [Pyrinomonadaceae bacterium]
MFRNTRTTLLTALVAALALTALVFAGVAGAQRAGAARQANTNAGGGNKRVVVRSGETARGSRMTVTADDSFKDYSAYRSGDRFYVVLPKSAAGAARGGSGKGYSDMQVQQRGDSVVLSFRVQPGAKPRVQQQFNRLEVVLDVPEGAGQQQQQAAASSEPSRNQQQPAETRNQTPAAQQQNQTAVTPPNTNPNNAAERVAAERAAAERAAEAARAQAANNAAPVVTTPPVLTAGQSATAVDPNAQPGATPSGVQPQEVAATPEGANAPPDQLAQAQPPASQAPVSITKPATAADPSGASLGAFLIRNWALTLIIALVVVGFGLVVAARRTTAATQEPAGGADAADAVVADEPRATRAKEATAAALKQASDTAEASIPAKASAPVKTPVPVETSIPVETDVPVEASAPVEASVPAETSAPVETSTPDAAEATDFDAKPLVAATALAGGAAVAKSRKLSRKEARQEAKTKKKGAREDGPAVAAEPLTTAPAAQELTVEETAAEETVVEETAVAEPVVEETGVEEFVAAPSAVEESAVEETAFEETPAEESAVAFGEVTPAEQVEEAALPVPTAEAPSFVEPSVEEVADVSVAPEAAAVEQHEVAAVETPFDTAGEATVETGAAPASTEIVPAVAEAFAPEVVEPEVSEPEVSEEVSEPVEAKAPAPFAEIESAFAPEPERVQAATRALLEGGNYDRSVIGTRDSFSRQMIAAELLAALAGRNEQRRERAGT